MGALENIYLKLQCTALSLRFFVIGVQDLCYKTGLSTKANEN